MEVIAFLILEGIATAIGWFCLLIWYRDRKKIKKIKNNHYAGSFSAAGKIFVLNFIAGTGAVVMFGIAITLLIYWIYKVIAT